MLSRSYWWLWFTGVHEKLLDMRRLRVPEYGAVVSGGQHAAIASIEIHSRCMRAIGVGFLLRGILPRSIRKDDGPRTAIIEDLPTVATRSPVVRGDQNRYVSQPIAKIWILEQFLPSSFLNVPGD